MHLDAPGSDNIELAFELSAISGKYKMCVSLQENITEWSQCDWEYVNNKHHVIVSSNDVKFQRNHKYGILVVPLYKPEYEFTNFTYILSVSDQDHFPTLSSGIASTIPMPSTYKSLKFPVSSSATGVTILLTSTDAKAKMQASTSYKEINEGTSVAIKNATGTHAAFYFDQSQIAQMCSGISFGCNIYLRVYPSEPKTFSYTITAFSNEDEILLSEGDVWEFPTPLSKDLVLYYYAIGSERYKNSGLTINVFSPKYNLRATAVFTERFEDGNLNSSSKFSIVDNEPLTNVIHVPASAFANLTNGFKLVLRISNDNDRSKDFDLNNRIIVQLSGETTTLESGRPYTQFGVKKGMTSYFSFSKHKNKEAFVYLRVDNGEVDLIASKGSEKFPTMSTYDFASTTSLNDELVLPVSDSASKNQETFTIGVYARNNSMFTIEATEDPKFHYHIIKPGEVISRTASPNKPLLLALTYPSLSKFTVGATADSGIVSIAYKQVDEKYIWNMKEFVMDDGGAVIETISPIYMSRAQVVPRAGNVEQSLFIFTVKPRMTTKVTFFAAGEGTPIKLPIGTPYADSLNAGDAETYVVEYDTEVTDETLSIEVDTGALTMYLSKQNPTANVKADLLKVVDLEGGHTTTTEYFNINNLLQPSAKEGSFGIFQKFYIRIVSKKPDTKFILHLYTPENRLRKLYPGQRFDLNMKKDQKQIYYYPITDKDVKSLKLIFNFNNVTGKPGDYITNKESVLNDVSFMYAPEGALRSENITLQANIKAQQDYNNYGYDMYVAEFDVQNGYFMIIPKSSSQGDRIARIQFIINDYKLLSPIGKTFEDIQPGKEYTYLLVKPKDSTLALTLSSCLGVAEIELYSNETAGAKPFDSFVVGRDFSDIFSKTIWLQPVTVRKNINSTTTYIKVKAAAGMTKATLLTIGSQLRDSNHPLVLEDYFSAYNMTNRDIASYYTVRRDSNGLNISFEPFAPSRGFEAQYSSFQQVDVTYTVQIVKTIYLSTNLDSECYMSNQLTVSEQESLRKVEAFSYKAYEGKIQWPRSNVEVQFEYPLDLEAPFTVVLQTIAVFQGLNTEARDDDATLVFKTSFTIHEPFLQTAEKYYKAIGYAALVLAAVVCYLGVKCAKQQMPTQSTKGARRLGQTEMNQLDLKENQSNRIETIEDTKGNELDQTV